MTQPDRERISPVRRYRTPTSKDDISEDEEVIDETEVLGSPLALGIAIVMTIPVVWAFGPSWPEGIAWYDGSNWSNLLPTSLSAVAALYVIVRSFFALLNIENSVRR